MIVQLLAVLQKPWIQVNQRWEDVPQRFGSFGTREVFPKSKDETLEFKMKLLNVAGGDDDISWSEKYHAPTSAYYNGNGHSSWEAVSNSHKPLQDTVSTRSTTHHASCNILGVQRTMNHENKLGVLCTIHNGKYWKYHVPKSAHLVSQFPTLTIPCKIL